MDKNFHLVDISAKTILKFLGILFLLYLLWLIRDIVVLVFVVILLVLALEPLVNKLTGWGIPRVLGVLFIYILLGIILGLVVYWVVPPLVFQLRDLAFKLPVIFNQLSDFRGTSAIATGQTLTSFSEELNKIGGGLLNATLAIFGGFVSALTVLVLTFYSLLDEKGFKKIIYDLIPLARHNEVSSIIQKIATKIGYWLRGQIVLMIIVGILDGAGLAILGIPFALTLGILAGFLEIIPLVGPLLAGLAAVLVSLAGGVVLWKILIVVGIFILVQQLEGHILVPRVMQKAIGLSPVAIILAVLIGAKLLGTGGAILAIPVAAILLVFSQEYIEKRRPST